MGVWVEGCGQGPFRGIGVGPGGHYKVVGRNDRAHVQRTGREPPAEQNTHVHPGGGSGPRVAAAVVSNRARIPGQETPPDKKHKHNPGEGSGPRDAGRHARPAAAPRGVRVCVFCPAGFSCPETRARLDTMAAATRGPLPPPGCSCVYCSAGGSRPVRCT